MNLALIFAGGVGKRMGNSGMPKQFLKLYGKEIIVYTLEIFENNENIDGIVISCLEEKIELLKELIVKYRFKKVKSIVPGGITGQESIYNGLKELEKYYSKEDIVLIHDGVRPLINNETVDNNIKTVRQKGNAITTTPAIETIIKLEDKKDVIKDKKNDFIDSASLMSYYGESLNILNGPVENIKITTPSDFYIFKAILDMKENLNIFGL